MRRCSRAAITAVTGGGFYETAALRLALNPKLAVGRQRGGLCGRPIGCSASAPMPGGAPSHRIELSQFDIRNPDGIRAVYELGLKDGAAFAESLGR
jgi:hypothetical protein